MRMWKKICAVLMAGAICAMSSPWTVSAAGDGETGTYGALTYTVLKNGTIEITDCDEAATEVEIPAEIDGMAVTGIADRAFSDCESLTEITVPDSVVNIGYGVFNGTPWLTAKQEENPFVAVNDILIDGTTCSGDIIIPDTIKYIGNYAFYCCDGLTEVIIPDSVTDIGREAFGSCANLTEITIPDSVTSIGEGAFSNCTSLTEITIPDSVISIGNYAFWICTSLTNVTIPDSVTSIGRWAFQSCTSLTKITIPDSVTSVGDETFASCTSLTEITIPDSVTRIGNEAFQSCTSLTDVYYNGTKEGWNAIEIGESNEDLLTAIIHFKTTAMGDVDNNGIINADDAYLCLLAYAKLSVGSDSGLTAAQVTVADVDGNGKITPDDAYYMLLYYAKKSVGQNPSWEELLS